MTLPPIARKLLLAIHLTASVGWFGAVVAYLPLDVAVATSTDPEAVRGSWGSMTTIASFVLVPLAVVALLTGLVLSLGTRWGVFRHWWVVISLALTTVAVTILIAESGVIAHSATIAADPTTSPDRLLALPSTLPHSVAGLVTLVIIQWLNVFKPSGLTPYGWSQLQQERARLRTTTSTTRSGVVRENGIDGKEASRDSRGVD